MFVINVAESIQSHVSNQMIFVCGIRSRVFLLPAQLLLKLDMVMFIATATLLAFKLSHGPYFSSDTLQVTAFMAAQLLPAHTEYLATHMGRNA